MKRLWIASALLALLLAASLGNAWYSNSLTQSLAQPLREAQQLARQDQWQQARELTRQSYDSWNAHHTYLHCVLRHSDTDLILRSFRSVMQYLDLEEMDQYAAANADLISQLELLSEMEQATVVNVL